MSPRVLYARTLRTVIPVRAASWSMVSSPSRGPWLMVIGTLPLTVLHPTCNIFYVTFSMSDTSTLIAPTAAAPAPGVAEASQVAVVVGVVSAALAGPLLRERTGHRTLLGALADRVAGLDGTPRWAAISPFLQTASILAAGF